MDYNRTKHTETGQAPLDRFRAGLDRVSYADEEKLRDAFLWRENRTPDKAGCFWLFGHRYQVHSTLGKKRIEIHYDPEALEEVEVWRKGNFSQRCRPFEVQRHRRPKAKAKDETPSTPRSTSPVADYLDHLVEKRRAERFIEPEPSVRTYIDEAHARREAADKALTDLLLEHLDAEAVDIGQARRFLDRYGPFDLERAKTVLQRLLSQHPPDQHVTFYLEAIRKALSKKEDSR